MPVREEDSGIQRILDRIDARFTQMEVRVDGRFDTVERRMEAIALDARNLAVSLGVQATELKNIKETEGSSRSIRWGMISGIAVAIIGTILNWIKGTKQ